MVRAERAQVLVVKEAKEEKEEKEQVVVVVEEEQMQERLSWMRRGYQQVRFGCCVLLFIFYFLCACHTIFLCR